MTSRPQISLLVSLLSIFKLFGQLIDQGALCGCIVGEPLCIDEGLRQGHLCIEVGIKECLCFRPPETPTIGPGELNGPDRL